MTLTMPLEGMRVLDLTHLTVGPFCTRILGDYGADVIKVERPGGDPARLLPPFAADQPGAERSGTFLFLNTNKRSVVLDLKDRADLDVFLALVSSADAIVENFSPGTLDRLGIGYKRLHEINPQIVLTSISNFGQTGPYRDWQATDITTYAMGGPMISTGDRDHDPVKIAGRWAGYHAGYLGALATVMALHARDLRGVGEHVDVSMFEASSHAMDNRLTQLLGYEHTGKLATRSSRVSGGLANGVYPCADGWYQLSSFPNYFPAVLRMIGRTDLRERPEWREQTIFRDPARIEELNGYLYPWLLERTMTEVRAACQEYGVLGAPINDIAQVLADENFAARGFFQKIDHPSTGPVAYPGYHIRVHSEDGPMPARRRAPLLGEHSDEVRAEAAALGKTPRSAAPPMVNRLGDRPPLDGIRILDFTVVFAGPYAAMHLADWGAELIRVESQQHFAANTRGFLAHPTREYAASGPGGYVDGEPGERPWNRAGYFNCHARGKKSMTLDLDRPEGQAILEELVAKADGIVENNMPSSIEKVGITWERLSKINPRLVMVRMPAFGLSGPYRNYRAIGSNMEALAGHPMIRAYPDLGLDYAPSGVPADGATGIGGALAFLMGLRHRDRTGKGVLMELSSTENIIPMLGEFVMDYSMNGRIWTHMGNDHWFLAPHNAYRCAGEDEWVVISVRNEDDWTHLCHVMLREDLLTDSRFATMAARHANRRELDLIVTAWTSERESRWVMRRLQRDRIPAGVVMNADQLLDDPQHAAREFFQWIDSPETGRHRYVQRAWKASRTPQQTMRYAPRLGEDNDYVYRDILGFSDEKYREFEQAGHIGMDYDPALP